MIDPLDISEDTKYIYIFFFEIRDNLSPACSSTSDSLYDIALTVIFIKLTPQTANILSVISILIYPDWLPLSFPKTQRDTF